MAAVAGLSQSVRAKHGIKFFRLRFSVIRMGSPIVLYVNSFVKLTTIIKFFRFELYNKPVNVLFTLTYYVNRYTQCVVSVLMQHSAWKSSQ